MSSTGEAAGRHALVFGASGITGWAIVNAIVGGYPEPSDFSRVTALANRPLSQEVSQWPNSDKLNIVSGLDLLKGSQAELEETLRSRVPNIESVSHVYFFAYIMDMDPEKEIEINVDLLRRAVYAVDNISTRLEFVVLPTGTKAYGVHLLRDGFPHANNLPLKESHPRVPEPHGSQIFYYHQFDLLKTMSQNKPWTFCDVIPDVIVGFVPHNNIYCLAQALALYLSLYRHINGEGSEVVFPGTMDSWVNLSSDSSQDIIAKFSIIASLHPEVSGGQRYNTADNNTPSNWRNKWPVICEYFGLKGVPPSEGPGPDPSKYVSENREKWLELEKEHGLRSGRVENERSLGVFPYFIMTMMDFDRHVDLTKMHDAWGRGGTVEETDTRGAWYTAFNRFKRAKIIP